MWMERLVSLAQFKKIFSVLRNTGTCKCTCFKRTNLDCGLCQTRETFESCAFHFKAKVVSSRFVAVL